MKRFLVAVLIIGIISTLIPSAFASSVFPAATVQTELPSYNQYKNVYPDSATKTESGATKYVYSAVSGDDYTNFGNFLIQEGWGANEDSIKRWDSFVEFEMTKNGASFVLRYDSNVCKLEIEYPQGSIGKDIPERIPTTIKVGDTVNFGVYPQALDGLDRTPIEWIVLGIEHGKALLISRYGLEAMPYMSKNVATTYEKLKETTWENCSLREWLNGVFLSSAFTETEQNLIALTEVDTKSNTTFFGHGGPDTEDYIFILDKDEINEYFETIDARNCKPTKYALNKGARINEETEFCYWWIRDPGTDNSDAMCVNGKGSILLGGEFVCEKLIVRPAMWIQLETE